MRGDDSAQAFTLEGFIGSMLILTAVLFALQSVIITPTTAGTVDRDVQSQHQTEADDILQQAKNNGTLKHLVLNYNGTSGEVFRDSINSEIGYGPNQPPTEFGENLNASFNQRGRVYNVVVEYRGVSNETAHTGIDSVSRNMVYRGVPSDNAIVATETVTIYDDDQMPNYNGTVLDAAEDDDYDVPVSDTAPDSPVFTVVEVRVVVW
jgi:hypothetical protein